MTQTNPKQLWIKNLEHRSLVYCMLSLIVGKNTIWFKIGEAGKQGGNSYYRMHHLLGKSTPMYKAMLLTNIWEPPSDKTPQQYESILIKNIDVWGKNTNNCKLITNNSKEFFSTNNESCNKVSKFIEEEAKRLNFIPQPVLFRTAYQVDKAWNCKKNLKPYYGSFQITRSLINEVKERNY